HFENRKQEAGPDRVGTFSYSAASGVAELSVEVKKSSKALTLPMIGTTTWYSALTTGLPSPFSIMRSRPEMAVILSMEALLLKLSMISLGVMSEKEESLAIRLTAFLTVKNSM